MSGSFSDAPISAGPISGLTSSSAPTPSYYFDYDRMVRVPVNTRFVSVDARLSVVVPVGVRIASIEPISRTLIIPPRTNTSSVD